MGDRVSVLGGAVTLVDASGKPVKRDTRCPQCQAGPDKRVASGGFGEPHDVCVVCGHEFQELTR
jgi:rubredoxin